MGGEYWSELKAALKEIFVQSLPKRKYPPYKTPKIKPLYLDKREKIHVCCRSNC